MPALTIKNIPDKLYNRVKERAAQNHRSINSEIIHIIEKATSSSVTEPEEHLYRARKLRDKSSSVVIKDSELSDFKNKGRR